MKTIILLLASLALVGCSATDERGMLLTEGVVRIEPATEAGYDYRFSIMNGWGITYDFEIEKDRVRAVGDYLTKECKSTEVIRETAFEQGTYGSGRPRKLYTIDVKCL